MSSEYFKELAEAKVQLESQEQENERLKMLVVDLRSELSLYKWTEDHKRQHKERAFFQKLLPTCSVQISNFKRSVLDSRMTISKQVNQIGQLKREISLLQDITQQLVTSMNQVATEMAAETANKNAPVNKGVSNFKYSKDLNGEQLRSLANEQSALLCLAKVHMLEAVQENNGDAKRHITNYMLNTQISAKTEKLKYEQQIRDYEASQKAQRITLQQLEKQVALFQQQKNSQVGENEKKLEEQVQILRKLRESVKGNEKVYKLAALVGFAANSTLSVDLAANLRRRKDQWGELLEEVSQQAGILKYLQSLVAEALYYCESQTKSNQESALRQFEDDTMKKQKEHTEDLKMFQERLTKAEPKVAPELREKKKQLKLREIEHNVQRETIEQLGRQTKEMKFLETQLQEERDLRLVADGKLFLLEDSFKSLKHFCENELKHRQEFLQSIEQSQNDKSKTARSATSSDGKEQLKSIRRTNRALELELEIKTNEIVLLKQNLKQMENQMYRTAFDSRFTEERNSMAKLHQEFMKTLKEFDETS